MKGLSPTMVVVSKPAAALDLYYPSNPQSLGLFLSFLLCQMPETARLYNDFTCAFIFKNKLNVTLENCKLLVEGLGIFKMTTFDQG